MRQLESGVVGRLYVGAISFTGVSLKRPKSRIALVAHDLLRRYSLHGSLRHSRFLLMYNFHWFQTANLLLTEEVHRSERQTHTLFVFVHAPGV